MVRIGNSNIINNKIVKVNFNDELYSFIKLLKVRYNKVGIRMGNS